MFSGSRAPPLRCPASFFLLLYVPLVSSQQRLSLLSPLPSRVRFRCSPIGGHRLYASEIGGMTVSKDNDDDDDMDRVTIEEVRGFSNFKA